MRNNADQYLHWLQGYPISRGFAKMILGVWADVLSAVIDMKVLRIAEMRKKDKIHSMRRLPSLLSSGPFCKFHISYSFVNDTQIAFQLWANYVQQPIPSDNTSHSQLGI